MIKSVNFRLLFDQTLLILTLFLIHFHIFNFAYCQISYSGPSDVPIANEWINSYIKNYDLNGVEGSNHVAHSPNHALIPEIMDGGHGKFDYMKEYNNWEHIFNNYLLTSVNCNPAEGLSIGDVNQAIAFANDNIEAYERAILNYLSFDPRGLNFSRMLAGSAVQSRYNELVTEFLARQKCSSKKDIALELNKIPVPSLNTPSGEYCLTSQEKNPEFYCEPNLKYRRLDGRCNNLNKPNWGAQFQCHRRLLPPDYADGISIIRSSFDNMPLPSARILTQFLQPDIRDVDRRLSLMAMQWGQVIAHDVTKTIQNLGLAIECCPVVDPFTGNIVQPPFHPECQPIVDFPLDQFTAQFNQTCINFIRSIACNTCQLGPRDQLNAATPVLDISNLYAGNLPREFALSMRTFTNGRLRTSIDANNEGILPARLSPQEADPIDLTPCNMLAPQFLCFHSGDGQRANQHPGINSLQVGLLRRHNQHAEALFQLNPSWNDETLYQEAKRILIAEMNRIHFGEYLPAILGKNLMDYFQLDLLSDGFTQYNPSVDPSTIQAFILSANRFGHSQSSSIFNVILRAFQGYSYLLRNKFFEMSDIWLGSAAGIVRGLLEDPSLASDPFEVDDLKQFLFATPNRTSLLDLAAIDIQRGREHGLPAYIYFLEYCTGAQVNSWQDLYTFIPEEQVGRISQVYRSVRDIDLIIGGISEKHVPGAVLGPTFACLTGMQFHHWKFGDRYYFEHGDQPGSFTLEQLNSIRQTSSLAGFLCKAFNLEVVQAAAMFRPTETNPKIPCESFPDINYGLWKDYQLVHYRDKK